MTRIQGLWALCAVLAIAFTVTAIARCRDNADPAELERTEHTQHAESTPTPPTTLDVVLIQPDDTNHYYEPDPTPTPTPSPIVPVAAASQGTARPISGAGAREACYANPDRYNWQKYALLAGFPPAVVESAEMARIIQSESGGDLCAVNASSGATCWIQQVPGGDAFFDPLTCMSQGYAKYLDGARNYPDRSPWWQHWYQWWE